MSFDNFDWIDARPVSRLDQPAAKSVMLMTKHEMKLVERKASAKEAMPDLPGIGISRHYISGAEYDFWMVIVRAIEIMDVVDEFYASTWTINRENTLELLELYDSGKLKKIGMLTGIYFKRRESAVYAQLLEGLRNRGQKYRAFRNHAKVVLLHSGDDYIIIEGGANLTSNPRLENYVIVNDRLLYEFHRDWMEDMLNG